MMKHFFLSPALLLLLTGCMNNLIDKSTDSIETNGAAIQRTTAAIYENARLIDESNKAIDENQRLIQKLSKE